MKKKMLLVGLLSIFFVVQTVIPALADNQATYIPYSEDGSWLSTGIHRWIHHWDYEPGGETMAAWQVWFCHYYWNTFWKTWIGGFATIDDYFAQIYWDGSRGMYYWYDQVDIEDGDSFADLYPTAGESGPWVDIDYPTQPYSTTKHKEQSRFVLYKLTYVFPIGWLLIANIIIDESQTYWVTNSKSSRTGGIRTSIENSVTTIDDFDELIEKNSVKLAETLLAIPEVKKLSDTLKENVSGRVLPWENTIQVTFTVDDKAIYQVILDSEFVVVDHYPISTPTILA